MAGKTERPFTPREAIKEIEHQLWRISIEDGVKIMEERPREEAIGAAVSRVAAEFGPGVLINLLTDLIVRAERKPDVNENPLTLVVRPRQKN